MLKTWVASSQLRMAEYTPRMLCFRLRLGLDSTLRFPVPGVHILALAVMQCLICTPCQRC